MALVTNTLGIMFVRMSSSVPGSEASSIGDWLSQQRAAQVLSMVTETVHRSGGIVMKSLTDSIIATFPAANSTLKAAIAMQEAMLESEDFESTQSAAHAQFDLSVALHLGQLVVAAGNISGDVVDEIAMLALESEPGQILATEALVAALRGDSKELVKGVQAQTRTLGAKPMGTFEVSRRPADQGPVEKTLTQQPPTKAPTLPLQAAPAPARTPAPAKVTQAATTPVRTPAAGGRTLQLSYEGTHLDLDEASPTLTIGRSPNNGLVVKSPHISRTHAVIEFSEGAFYLVNQSANGSCLKAQGHDEVPCTERLVLEGKGVIGLGPDFTRCGGQLIEYRLL